MESEAPSPIVAERENSPTASILAVGTELTTGQITNRNASWISERLVNLGVEVVLHETVPDERDLIFDALERCSRASRLIFVTGGLGPTTDDFTREVIAQWSGRPLEFHEPSWRKIQERLSRLGIPIAPSNRQQCYFPSGSSVLTNSAGTADGFTFQKGDATLRVLPGPPREIEVIWKETGIDEAIRRSLPGKLERLRLLTWQCLGKSEAELGELTESVLAGTGLRTGYRAHRPYVEIKVWVPESGLAQVTPDLKRLEEAIRPWLMGKQGEDLAVMLAKVLDHDEEIEILDSCTSGYLAERLSAVFRMPDFTKLGRSVVLTTEWNSPEFPRDWIAQALEQADEQGMTLAVAGISPAGDWALGLRQGNHRRCELLQSPYRNPELLERSRTYIVETALKLWLDWQNSIRN